MRLSALLLASASTMAACSSMHAADLWGQPTAAASQAPASGYHNGYVVGYPPNAATATPSYEPASGYAALPSSAATTYVDPNSVAPLVNNGSYQAQRPAYFDNPSVYTGLPTTADGTAYPTYRAPLTGSQLTGSQLTDSLRGNAMTVQPMQTHASWYASGFDGSLPGQPMTVTTPTGAPATAIPATTVAPLFPPPPPPQKRCCLSRFWDHLFGTSYQTSYYRAPVTFYRPVTSMDPVTGAPVVVQQPCTAFEQQVQRTPYTSLQIGQPTVLPPSGTYPTQAPCPTTSPNCGPSGYSYAPSTASPTAGYGSTYTVPPGMSSAGTIGQVGAMDAAGGASQIPSMAPTLPSGGQTWAPSSPYYSPSNTAPLTGAPTIAPPPGSRTNGETGDLTPVDQPQLNNGAAPSLPPQNSPPARNDASPSQWQLQNPEDSTALIRPRSSTARDTQPSEPTETSSSPRPSWSPQDLIENHNFTRAEPIEAPDDYVAPYRRQTFQTPRTTPVTNKDLGTIDSPNVDRSYGAADLTSISARVPQATATPNRGTSTRFSHPPIRQPRDSSWTPVRQGN